MIDKKTFILAAAMVPMLNCFDVNAGVGRRNHKPGLSATHQTRAAAAPEQVLRYEGERRQENHAEAPQRANGDNERGSFYGDSSMQQELTNIRPVEEVSGQHDMEIKPGHSIGFSQRRADSECNFEASDAESSEGSEAFNLFGKRHSFDQQESKDEMSDNVSYLFMPQEPTNIRQARQMYDEQSGKNVPVSATFLQQGADTVDSEYNQRNFHNAHVDNDYAEQGLRDSTIRQQTLLNIPNGADAKSSEGSKTLDPFMKLHRFGQQESEDEMFNNDSYLLKQQKNRDIQQAGAQYVDEPKKGRLEKMTALGKGMVNATKATAIKAADIAKAAIHYVAPGKRNQEIK